MYLASLIVHEHPIWNTNATPTVLPRLSVTAGHRWRDERCSIYSQTIIKDSSPGGGGNCQASIPHSQQVHQTHSNYNWTTNQKDKCITQKPSDLILLLKTQNGVTDIYYRAVGFNQTTLHYAMLELLSLHYTFLILCFYFCISITAIHVPESYHNLLPI